MVGGGAALLALVLVLRFLARLFGFAVSYSLIVSGGHLGIAGWALYQVGRVPYRNFHTGSTEPLPNDAIARCAKIFLGLLFLQICRTAYSAPASSAAMPPKASPKSNGQKPGHKGKKH